MAGVDKYMVYTMRNNKQLLLHNVKYRQFLILLRKDKIYRLFFCYNIHYNVVAQCVWADQQFHQNIRT